MEYGRYEDKCQASIRVTAKDDSQASTESCPTMTGCLK